MPAFGTVARNGKNGGGLRLRAQFRTTLGFTAPRAWEVDFVEIIDNKMLIAEGFPRKNKKTKELKKVSAHCACDNPVAQLPRPNPQEFEFLAISNFKEFVVRAFRIKFEI